MATTTMSLDDLAKRVDEMGKNYDESLDTIWMLFATSLVFFMHSGFTLLEAGSVRQKNTQNILGKNLIVVTVGFLCWWAVGYALAFGTPEAENKFVGGAHFFLHGFEADKTMLRNWVFQGAFCATGSTIVSGAVAERTQLKGFITFTLVMTSVIYPVVIWWGWSGKGFLSYDDGRSIVGPALIDFAGSGLVHLSGGVAALCGAIIVGPRKGRFDANSDESFDAHSVPFCAVGTFFLWFGWYGFNAGSTLEMHTVAKANSAGLVAVNTTLAACVGGLLVFLLRAKVVAPKALDVPGFCNGVLAGLVSITAGCGEVQPWEAILIGLLGGVFYQGMSMLVLRLKVDDVVDAAAVHGACGLWGVLAPGLFGSSNGVAQMGVQAFAAALIILWVGTLSVLVMLPLRLLGMLRLSDNFQEQGADLMEHSPAKAYAGSQVDGPASGV